MTAQLYRFPANWFLAKGVYWEEHLGVITKRGRLWGCTSKTVKNGTKWEGMDKLMIWEDFFLLGVVSSLASPI